MHAVTKRTFATTILTPPLAPTHARSPLALQATTSHPFDRPCAVPRILSFHRRRGRMVRVRKFVTTEEESLSIFLVREPPLWGYVCWTVPNTALCDARRCEYRTRMSLRAFINSPTGPKTTHFWGPVANWGFVLAVRRSIDARARKRRF